VGRDLLTARLSPLERVHPYTFKEHLLSAARELGRLYPQEIEKFLRLGESDIYLIADPVTEYPGGHALLPHTGTKEYPYAIGMTMAGLESAMGHYEERGVTAEQNFWRLANSGVLTQSWCPVFPTNDFCS